ncbi:MAG: sugar ABC transporter substrate-binding protein [Anaerolineae bacterium]|nr:sugar ABC transporter substrate-binding protein [Anaerolineae bacterium]
MARKALSRRDFLKLSALVSAGMAASPLMRASAAETPYTSYIARMQAAFDWMQAKGATINVLLSKNPWADNIEKWLPEFQQLTGITVKLENIPEIQSRQKITVDFAGGGTIDCFYTGLHVEKRRFSKAGWYEDLTPYLKDAALTAPDYDYEKDIFGASRSAVTGAKGEVYALPTFTDVWVYCYRKDLFEQKSLKAPATLDDMMNLAKTLNNPPELYGFVARGLKNANAIGFTWVLRSLGGQEIVDGKANFLSKEALDAMNYYAGILKQYGPPGVVNYNWQESIADFGQGKAAQFFDGVNFFTQLEDETKSKVKGKVGYTLLPAGSAKQEVPTFTNGMSVSSQSKNKKAAYLFCQWATSKDIALKQQLAGVGSARTSAWDDKSVKEKATMPQDWTDSFLKSLEVGKLGLPEIAAVTEYRDIIGVAIQKVIQGDDAKAALEQAQKDLQVVLDKTEK